MSPLPNYPAPDRKRLRHGLNERDGVVMGLQRQLERLRRQIFVSSMAKNRLSATEAESRKYP